MSEERASVREEGLHAERVDSRMAGNSPASRLFYRIARFILCGGIRSYTRMIVIGGENIPTDGAFVLAPTHRSYIDTPIAGVLYKRRMRFMGKGEMWHSKWFGWIISALGAFPVRRGQADREALTRCIEVLESGEPLVLFPEGERKDGPVVQPLFDGAAYVAARGKVPIIPVGIGGSAQVMPRHAKFVYPHRTCVIVGEPIEVERSESGRASRRAVHEVTEKLHAELQRLFDEASARVS